MKDWRAILVSIAALAGVFFMAYLVWIIFRGKDEMECMSTAYTFGCFTHAVTLLEIVGVLEFLAAVYLWTKLRGD